MAASKRGLKLVEVAVVILFLVGGAAVLLPSLSVSRKMAMKSSLSRIDQRFQYGDVATISAGSTANAPEPAAPARAIAHVKTYKATIELTPKISVGTSTPESIYEVRYKAEIDLKNPAAAKQECELQLPLPPQIISLADLEINVSGEPSEDVFFRNGMLVWYGRLDETKPVPMTVTYTAVGKGIYTLETPPGKIVDVFDVSLTARQTNVQMMELSLQPVERKRESGDTIYRWSYKRLMLGRPIALDVLGIAPMDKLGELSWLGPVSILIFGLLTALLVMAFRPAKLDKWMLLLIVGAFTGAYALMYYAQDYMSLTGAMVLSGAVVLAIIGVRAATLLGVRVGLGVLIVAGAIMAMTLWAAVQPGKQGLLLTAMILGTFVLAMILLPKAQRAFAPATPTPPPAILVDQPPKR